MKNVYLDMDGTIANLYDQENWLSRLTNEDCKIFEECEPMVTEKQLFDMFPKDIYNIKILTMTPKDCTQSYHENVIEQKNKWLDKYFPNLKKRIFMKYGNNKNLKNSKNAILVDDNEKIRLNFKGISLNPIDLWG